MVISVAVISMASKAVHTQGLEIVKLPVTIDTGHGAAIVSLTVTVSEWNVTPCTLESSSPSTTTSSSPPPFSTTNSALNHSGTLLITMRSSPGPSKIRSCRSRGKCISLLAKSPPPLRSTRTSPPSPCEEGPESMMMGEERVA